MSGKRISKAQRRIILGNRRYVKTIRENEYETFGNNLASTKAQRAAERIGK